MGFLTKVLSLFPNEPSEMNMSPWTLAFEGKAESEYTKEKNVDYIGQKRIGLIAAILIYAVFFFLDMAVMPEYKYFVWFVRFVFIFITIAVILLSYVERVSPYLNHLISFVLVLGGVGNLVMIRFAPVEVASSYYAGLILMFMLCYGILRTNFLLSSITGLMILVAYELSAVFFMEVPKYVLLNNNFFYLAANVLGMLSAYKADYNSRRGFYLSYKLEEAQKALRKSPRKYVPVEMPEEPVAAIVAEVAEPETAQAVVEETLDFEKDMRDAGMTVRMLMERISDVVWYSDLEGNFIYVSPSCQKLWGYDSEQAQNMNFKELFTRESYEYYMAELESALASNEDEIRPLDLEIICKNRVIKSGEVVSIAVKDHDVYGSGIIGVTRDVSLRKSTENELRRFNEELEELIHKRTVELEDALDKLKGMEEAFKTSEEEKAEIINATEEKEEVVVVPEVIEDEELPIIREVRNVVEDNLKTVVHLKEMTKQIVKLYDIKTMKRFDLEKYFRDATRVIGDVDHKLRNAAKQLSGQEPTKMETVPEPVVIDKVINTRDHAFNVGDTIEKVFIGLGHRFADTNHVVEILCADEISAMGDSDLYTQVIENLVSYSLDYGFKNTAEGEIIIDVSKEDDILSILYKDNGSGLTDETIKQLFGEPYKMDTVEESHNEVALYHARGVVQNQLAGDFECKNGDSGIEFMIMIPDKMA